MRKEVILINRKDLPEANATCKTCGRKYRLCNRCLKLRSMGIESWREHYDCIECFQVSSVLDKDMKDITKEEFDYIKEIQLPEGQEYTEEVKNRFAEVERFLDAKNNSRITVKTDDNENVGREENRSAEYKQYGYNYNKKKNKMSYKGK